MSRYLFRFCLYPVFIAMLIFPTVGLGRRLQAPLAITPLRGAYGARPLNPDIVQAGVFFLFSFVKIYFLWGMHYSLVSRGMDRSTPAGQRVFPYFFLKIPPLIIVPLPGFF